MRKTSLPRWTLILAVLVLAMPVFTFGQEIEYVGSALWGHIQCVDVVDNYAYCAFGCGLGILDISNPDSIYMLSSLYLPGSCTWIDVEGDYAYMANMDNGLFIANITNPVTPYLASKYLPEKEACRVLISDNFAYLKTVDSTSTTFEFIDISEPSNPVFAGSYTVPERFWTNIFVVTNYAYIAASSYGFQILDISNPAMPETISVYQSEYSYGDIFISGNYAYITGTTPNGPPYGAFMVFDISNPYNPEQTHIEQAYDPFGRLIVEDGYLFVQYSEDGRVVIWDLADPSNPDYVSF